FQNTVVRNPNGQIVGVLFSGEDITDRVQAEKALKESDAQKKAILDGSIDRIRLADKDMRIIWVNKTTVRELNMPPKDLGGEFCYKILSDRDTPCPDCLSKKAFKSGNIEHAILYRPKLKDIEGETYWDAYAVPIEDESGDIVNMIQIVRNITEQVRTEEALKESELWMRNMFNALEEAVLLITPDRVIIDINEAAEKMFGYSKGELINRSTEILHVDHEHYLEFGKQIKEAFDSGQAAQFEFDEKRKNGEIFPTERTVCLLKNDEGNPMGIVSAIRDLSEEKRAEQEKEKLQAQLQRSQKMEVIGTLAGGVAHDLNNILSGIVTYPELILLEIPEDSPLRNAILTIQKSGEKAVAVVQDLLTLARRGVAVTEVVNLNLVISEYVKSPEHERITSFHPGVHVETNLEEELLNILGSPAHLSKT
ncbi:unnamed protein product, partial [marine sediment metagenome]